MIFKRFIFAVVAILIAASLEAQVINPTTVAFIAPSDYATILNGVPVVDHYEVSIYNWTQIIVNGVPGTYQIGSLVWTEPIGKPTPDTSGIVTVIVAKLSTLTRGTYVGLVTSKGADGSMGVGDLSDPFVISGIMAKPGKAVFKR